MPRSIKWCRLPGKGHGWSGPILSFFQFGGFSHFRGHLTLPLSLCQINSFLGKLTLSILDKDIDSDSKHFYSWNMKPGCFWPLGSGSKIKMERWSGREMRAPFLCLLLFFPHHPTYLWSSDVTSREGMVSSVCKKSPCCSSVLKSAALVEKHSLDVCGQIQLRSHPSRGPWASCR